MRKLTIYVFMLLFLSSLAMAVQPAPATYLLGQSGGDIQIEYPKLPVLKQNESFHFNFHVFNFTGQPLNKSLDCNFHLYNSTGNHIVDASVSATTSHLFDYKIIVLGENFSTIGSYSYIFQCYNLTSTIYAGSSYMGYGGFVSEPIIVTKTGGDDSSFNNFSFFMVILIFLVFLGLVVAGLFIFKRLWQSAVLVVAFNIIVTSLLRISTDIVHMTNPAASGIIDYLNKIYGWGVTGIYLSIMFAMLVGMWYATLVFRKKSNDDMGGDL